MTDKLLGSAKPLVERIDVGTMVGGSCLELANRWAAKWSLMTLYVALEVRHVFLQELQPFVRKCFPGKVRLIVTCANDLPLFVLMPFLMTVFDIDTPTAFI